MELSKEIAGRKLRPYSFVVERGKVREFCRAIGETNPLYLDPEVARRAGFRDTPIPPTFQTVFQFWGYTELWDDMRSMGIDTDRLLHMKEDYTYHSPVYPGETIHAEGEVVDVKVGKMSIVVFHTTYTGEDGAPRIEARMSIIIRPKEGEGESNGNE